MLVEIGGGFRIGIKIVLLIGGDFGFCVAEVTLVVGIAIVVVVGQVDGGGGVFVAVGVGDELVSVRVAEAGR